MTAGLADWLETDDDGWRLTSRGWDADRIVAAGSNFLVGNGYLGYRGTTPEQGAADYVALVVSDTYDCADGRLRELTTAPNPLYVAAAVEGQLLRSADAATVELGLDLRCGEFVAHLTHEVPGGEVSIMVERFASYDDLHLLAQRWTMTADVVVDVDLIDGIDGEIWSLNGTHLPELTLRHDGRLAHASGTTAESGIDVVVAAISTVAGAPVTEAGASTEQRRAMQRRRFRLEPGAEIVVETVAAVVTSNDTNDPATVAEALVHRAADDGFSVLRAATRSRWAEIWKVMDVVVGGDPTAQICIRFNAYHNRISTPAHSDRLPIGARGLSCQAYQGAAFWDQEIYNLPAFLFTEPEIARSLLVYRHRTLDGARRKASGLGYTGAFYAWMSGDTGDELCPDYFFEDVITGRPIRNHFNDWQMHVAPDIVTSVARYVAVTGDERFLLHHGAEIAFEVARFLHAFVRYDEWRRVYHCIRLLGPDEWHENVDDNAFTNHQVHAALDFAVATYEQLARDHPAVLDRLSGRLDLEPSEVDGWRRVRDHLLLPGPDPETGLIEQFAGFFELEDITPAELSGRLIEPTEYWGWPNGIAIATQVSKQADVVMLLWLHRSEFDDAAIRANYEYYELRCSHNSSLSHAAHAMVAARMGDLDRAVAHFSDAATVDLLSTQHPLVGGTFIGGVHTAAAGGVYQVAVQGFGGLDFRDGSLHIDPALPPGWTALEYPVAWRGHRLRVEVTHDHVEVGAAAENPAPVEIMVRGTATTLAPGTSTVVP